MKEQFCTYEIALKLKELGFEELCLMYYYIGNKSKLHSNIATSTIHGAIISEEEYIIERQIKAPLWQQAIDWLREKHNLYININPPEYWRVQIEDMKPHQCSFIIRSYNTYIGESPDNPFALIRRSFESYDEAREAAILKAIKLCQKEKHT